MSLLREKTSLDVRINDQEYEMQELLKKYKAQVQQGSVVHITLNDQIRRIADLEKERDSLSDKVHEDLDLVNFLFENFQLFQILKIFYFSQRFNFLSQIFIFDLDRGTINKFGTVRSRFGG